MDELQLNTQIANSLERQVNAGCPSRVEDESTLANDLDEKIRDVVLLLRAHGFKTFASCSGEEGHCFSYPMVRMEAEDLPRERARLLTSLDANGYNGFYVKEWYSSGGSSFLEVEFWGLDCLKRE